MVYPEWVTRWKTKGTHITRQGDRYYLNRVHSVWKDGLMELGQRDLDEVLDKIRMEGRENESI